MIPRNRTDWAEIIRDAESPSRQWTLFTVLADRMALTADMRPGEVIALVDEDPSVALLASLAICQSTLN
jgi:hypothetical protein